MIRSWQNEKKKSNDSALAGEALELESKNVYRIISPGQVKLVLLRANISRLPRSPMQPCAPYVAQAPET